MTETPQSSPESKPRRRWTGWLLVASLAVNLFVLGSIGGWAWKHGPGGHWRGSRDGDERILWLVPEAKREAASNIVVRYRQAREARKGEIEAARKAVTAALLAEPFARPALEQALKELGSAELDRRLQPEMFGEIASILSIEERRELATNVERLLDRRGRRRDR
ncbi:MAG: periplasmic heavy metal sensor [Hyphomicrobiaceae bacterium]